MATRSWFQWVDIAGRTRVSRVDTNALNAGALRLAMQNFSDAGLVAATAVDSALDAGIPLSVILGRDQLRDHFSKQYINQQCGRPEREWDDEELDDFLDGRGEP